VTVGSLFVVRRLWREKKRGCANDGKVEARTALTEWMLGGTPPVLLDKSAQATEGEGVRAYTRNERVTKWNPGHPPPLSAPVVVEAHATGPPKSCQEGLMQLGVFGFCGDEDGDIGVGVFPECEESTAPNENRSVRVSNSSPPACSGDM
jgi:hypothetical protein